MLNILLTPMQNCNRFTFAAHNGFHCIVHKPNCDCECWLTRLHGKKQVWIVPTSSVNNTKHRYYYTCLWTVSTPNTSRLSTRLFGGDLNQTTSTFKLPSFIAPSSLLKTTVTNNLNNIAVKQRKIKFHFNELFSRAHKLSTTCII